MKFIYQIRRFEISLKKYFKDKAKLILIYPVSIIYNESAVNVLQGVELNEIREKFGSNDNPINKIFNTSRTRKLKKYLGG